MTLMVIAVAGILLGLACVLVGFFMEGSAARPEKVTVVRVRRAKAVRRKPTLRKKAA